MRFFLSSKHPYWLLSPPSVPIRAKEWGAKLTAHLHLVLKSLMSGAVSTSLYTFVVWIPFTEIQCSLLCEGELIILLSY